MLRIFRASELPPDVPSMVMTDGTDAVVLINSTYIDDRALCTVMTGLLCEVGIEAALSEAV